MFDNNVLHCREVSTAKANVVDAGDFGCRDVRAKKLLNGDFHVIYYALI